MPFQIVFLWSDLLLWLLVLCALALGIYSAHAAHLARAWERLGRNSIATGSATLLCAFLLVGLADSLHYRERLPPAPGAEAGQQDRVMYGVEVFSALDWLLTGLREGNEKTYSAPLATRLYAMESLETAAGTVRAYPRLIHGGARLADEGERGRRIALRLATGLACAAFLIFAVVFHRVRVLARQGGISPRAARRALWRNETRFAWRGVLAALAGLALVVLPMLFLCADFHILGTDKAGQDVFYQALKSIRTALVIGLVTTLVMLPLAIMLGIAAGYFRGWVDDLIQYLYTVINSIPGVLLIAAAVLMMQVVIDTHQEWFSTAAERADLRLVALCAILGMTSWTGLARLLRGEALKQRELEYIQAARAFGVSSLRIIVRHVLPNLMHIVIIALVMDFSALVLAEAVLSYVGIGVDPAMMSFGTMINNARMELSREPVVWWSLAAAFAFMFTLVLSANLFADAVRDAFDPHGA